MTTLEIVLLIVVAVLLFVLALFWSALRLVSKDLEDIFRR